MIQYTDPFVRILSQNGRSVLYGIVMKHGAGHADKGQIVHFSCNFLEKKMNENRNKENIIVSNRSAIHCLRWLQLGCIAVVLLDLLRFFELDITAVILGCTTSFILMSIPQAIMHFAGPELAGLRYVTIAAVVISSFLMNPVVGYESQLIYACPLLLSIQYTTGSFRYGYFLSLY